MVKLNSNPLILSVGQDVTAIGWGDTNINVDNQELSIILMNIDMSIISKEECGARGFTVTDSMISARANGHSSCSGNSGGPMVIKGNGGTTGMQVGVILWEDNGQSLYVFARVSQVYDWIQSEGCKGSNYATEARFDCSFVLTNPPISSPTTLPWWL